MLDEPGDSVSQIATVTLHQPLTIRLELSNGFCMDYDIIDLFVHDTLGMHITTNQYRIQDSIYNQTDLALDLFSSDGFTNYMWFAEDTLGYPVNEFTDDQIQNTQVIPTQKQMVGVFALNPDNCYERDTVWLVIRRPIDVPYDVFTPNNDGKNDFWVIPFAEQYPDLEVFIFNRWGQQVFYSNPYGGDQFHMWDGTSQKNGKELPIGSYYYIIKINDGEQEPITGTVTIIR
jgi:gliding motility-associated-like protein